MAEAVNNEETKEGNKEKKEGEPNKKIESNPEKPEEPQGPPPPPPLPPPPVVKTKEDVWMEGVPMPQFYFQPTLVDMLVPIMATNYKEFPYFGDMSAEIRERIVGLLPIDLPLELICDLILEESYWKRRSLPRWRNCDIACHGDSWKQLFFERNFNDFLESYELTKDWEEDLRDLMIISEPYVHNIDVRKFPSHMQFLILNDGFQTNLCTLKIEYGKPNVCMDYDIKDFGILNSDCMSLSYMCSVTYTLTELNLSSSLLKDHHVKTLVDGMAKNPTVVNLDLSHNMIGDVGCENLAKLLDAKNCVVLFLNLCNNKIRKIGTRALGYSLSANKSLLSLNLRLNDLGDYGGHRIFDYMMDNQVIERLSMSGTGFTIEGVEALAKLLHLPQSELVQLDISANPGIGVAGGQLIYAGLLAKKKMKELNVKKCGIGAELEAKFEALLMARKFDEEDIFLEEEKKKEEEEKKKKEDEEKRKHDPDGTGASANEPPVASSPSTASEDSEKKESDKE